MKKDTYPDVRIEIISEGLAKKILGKPETATPSVYGEEKPTGENLPNVDSKSRNKELQSLLETSNKKPDYTGLVKESIQELRKDNHDRKYKTAREANITPTAPKLGEPALISESSALDPETEKITVDAPSRTGTLRNFGIVETDDGQKSNVGPLLSAMGYGRGISAAPETAEQRDAILTAGSKNFDQSKLSPTAGMGLVDESGVPLRDSKDAQSRKKSSIESQVASQTQNMIKEAIQELRKAPVDYGVATPGGKSKTTVGAASSAAGREEAVQSQARLKAAESLKTGSGVAGAMDAGREYASSLQAGTGGVEGPVGPGFKPSSYRSGGEEFVRPETVGEMDKDPGVNYGSIGSMGAPGTGTAKGGDIPGGDVRTAEDYNRNKVGTADSASLVGGPDKLPDESAGNVFGRTDYEAPPEDPPNGGNLDGMAGNVAGSVTGTDPNAGIIGEPQGSELGSEFNLGVKADPNKTRPNNPTTGKALPAFGSSAYFDAVLNIGEGNTKLNSTNYGVDNLEDFLELYPQNPDLFSEKTLKEKYGDDSLANLFGTTQKADFEKAEVENPFKASLKKAPMVGGAAGQMPKSTTMNRPPNMGVGMQQPVVTGAGTMKNTEKAVAANKPRAAGASKKTRATKRKAGSIADLAKQALIKKGMVWDVRIRDWVSIK
mgnify:CR=1 FL=1